MAAKSDFLENKIIDWLFRGQSYTPPATLHFALLTVNTDDDGSPLTEVSGGSYARVAVTPSLANFAGTQGAGTTVTSTGNTGTTSNNAAITFPAPSANWGSVVGMAIYDAATGGNMLIYTPLTVPKTVNNGDAAPVFAAGAFTYQDDN
jgi:hypothetical protein